MGECAFLSKELASVLADYFIEQGSLHGKGSLLLRRCHKSGSLCAISILLNFSKLYRGIICKVIHNIQTDYIRYVNSQIINTHNQFNKIYM